MPAEMDEATQAEFLAAMAHKGLVEVRGGDGNVTLFLAGVDHGCKTTLERQDAIITALAPVADLDIDWDDVIDQRDKLLEAAKRMVAVRWHTVSGCEERDSAFRNLKAVIAEVKDEG